MKLQLLPSIYPVLHLDIFIGYNVPQLNWYFKIYM